MPIIDLQLRLREVGRIRMGAKGERGQPVRLGKWRLTAADKGALDAAAELYGGAVRPWQERDGQYELYTDASEIPFVISPIEISQWYELWSGGGCLRRCDGANDTISDAPCICDPEKRECKPTTRFAVFLHELPVLGVWRFESHGYYAAAELPENARMLRLAMDKGMRIPATLAIEQRAVKRGVNGKVQTQIFPVPVIRIRQRLADLLLEGPPARLAVTERPPDPPEHEICVLVPPAPPEPPVERDAVRSPESAKEPAANGDPKVIALKAFFAECDRLGLTTEFQRDRKAVVMGCTSLSAKLTAKLLHEMSDAEVRRITGVLDKHYGGGVTYPVPPALEPERLLPAPETNHVLSHPEAAKEGAAGQCPKCHAPAGKPHATRCGGPESAKETPREEPPAEEDIDPFADE